MSAVGNVGGYLFGRAEHLAVVAHEEFHAAFARGRVDKHHMVGVEPAVEHAHHYALARVGLLQAGAGVHLVNPRFGVGLVEAVAPGLRIGYALHSGQGFETAEGIERKGDNCKFSALDVYARTAAVNLRRLVAGQHPHHDRYLGRGDTLSRRGGTACRLQRRLHAVQGYYALRVEFLLCQCREGKQRERKSEVLFIHLPVCKMCV